MATITRTFDIPAPADTVWDRIADVGAVDKLIDFVSDIELAGDYRSCSMGEHPLSELIVSVDDAERRLVYSIRTSPFEFEHHSASMQAVSNGNGETKFVWIHDFKPDAVAPALEAAMDEAIVSIVKSLS